MKSKEVAMIMGHTFYAGSPCKKCGNIERYLSTGACKVCAGSSMTALRAMDLAARRAAVKSHQLRYSSPKPCAVHGGNAMRYTVNGRCVSCNGVKTGIDKPFIRTRREAEAAGNFFVIHNVVREDSRGHCHIHGAHLSLGEYPYGSYRYVKRRSCPLCDTERLSMEYSWQTHASSDMDVINFLMLMLHDFQVLYQKRPSAILENPPIFMRDSEWMGQMLAKRARYYRENNIL